MRYVGLVLQCNCEVADFIAAVISAKEFPRNEFINGNNLFRNMCMQLIQFK